MSIDPYHEVQSEIQSSLQTAGQLRASFVRIRSTAREGSEELEWARNEVCFMPWYIGIRMLADWTWALLCLACLGCNA